MKTPHKHVEIIKAWADGETIEFLTNESSWRHTDTPTWLPELVYRVKPEPELSVHATNVISNLMQACAVAERALCQRSHTVSSKQSMPLTNDASLKPAG